MLTKSKLNGVKVLISKTLIDSVISHDEFVFINVLKEYKETKEEIKVSRLNMSFGLRLPSSRS